VSCGELDKPLLDLDPERLEHLARAPILRLVDAASATGVTAVRESNGMMKVVDRAGYSWADAATEKPASTSAAMRFIRHLLGRPLQYV
jgi:hypothetical protein